MKRNQGFFSVSAAVCLLFIGCVSVSCQEQDQSILAVYSNGREIAGTLIQQTSSELVIESAQGVQITVGIAELQDMKTGTELISAPDLTDTNSGMNITESAKSYVDRQNIKKILYDVWLKKAIEQEYTLASADILVRQSRELFQEENSDIFTDTQAVTTSVMDSGSSQETSPANHDPFALPGKAQQDTNRKLLSTVKEALGSYRIDTGTWPEKFQDLNEDSGLPGWRGPYLADIALPVQDSWGTDLIIRVKNNPFGGNGYMELYSAGINQRDDQGRGDDLRVVVPIPKK